MSKIVGYYVGDSRGRALEWFDNSFWYAGGGTFFSTYALAYSRLRKFRRELESGRDGLAPSVRENLERSRIITLRGVTE